jgi:endoglucanase
MNKLIRRVPRYVPPRARWAWIVFFLLLLVASPSGHAGTTADDRYALPARMRGINTQTLGGCPTPEMAQQFAKWGVNIVRINFEVDNPDGKVIPTATDPLAPYRGNIAILKTFLGECKKYNIRVILCADTVYGRSRDDFYKSGGDSSQVNNNLLDFWKAFATEFKDDPTIVAYDVLNEPNYSPDHPERAVADQWTKELFPSALREIRAINPNIWVVVMPWPWGLVDGFTGMPVYDDPHIIYSFHDYSPHTYTHQGVGQAYQATRGKYSYPGMLKEYDNSPQEYWNRAKYLASVQPAIDFQKKNHVRILVGEFGVIRWAPGRDKYLTDVLSVLEGQGWDWTFHTLGTWNGWNPTYGPDAKQAGEPPEPIDGGRHSERFMALLKDWAKNRTDKKVPVK